MCANTLYWHDYETWGANPSADKPSQFAGIRTDEALNIIEEEQVFYCKPSDDCLPQPQACLITGISPQLALKKGLPEPQFFDVIYQALSRPGTCGVGYNSIRFDDEVGRYGFYRNFFDPYEREWKNGNSRWDIIDMVRLVYALKPDTLKWPMTDEGQPSFKLERLSHENGLEHSSAHDALSDVRATIALAKCIKERQPQLFDYCYALRNKQRVKSLIDIQQRKPLLHISSRFPASHGCAALVVPLMQHPSNANSVICYNLSVDPEPLLTLAPEVIAERVYCKQEDLPDGVERIPLKEVHINRSPILVTPKLLDDTAAVRLKIDKMVCEANWQRLRQANLDATLKSIYQHNPFKSKQDPEQQLYDGFIEDGDRALLVQIRQAEPETLAHFSTRLKDERLRTLLFRYRARHYHHTLNEDERERWQQWRYSRLTDHTFGASITLDQYFQELEQLGQEDSVNQALLNDLYEYGDQLLA